MRQTDPSRSQLCGPAGAGTARTAKVGCLKQVLAASGFKFNTRVGGLVTLSSLKQKAGFFS